MMLSILVPTLEERAEFMNSLMVELGKQVYTLSVKSGTDYWEKVQILKDPRGKEVTIGEKRNDLLQAATGKYVCFIDDDDRVAKDYIETVLNAIESGPDNLSLRGVYTVDGEMPELFEHSIRYSEYKTTERPIKYERYPNHLNVIKASIAKQFQFPFINHGEDTKWATLVYESGLLKKEIFIDKVMYYYKYRTNK